MNGMTLRFKESRYAQLLLQIHSSLWFTPALVVILMAALAVGLTGFDRHADDLLRQKWPRLFAVEPEGARSILSTIAGAMATIAGVAFSITMVALALASNQYTSRVMRNFMRDRANQVVLGIFMGVFIYCLLVLRTLSGGQGAFVPSAAVFGALVLAVVASGAFLFFVHHISASIQASDMAQAITHETLAAIDEMYPDAAREDSRPAPPLGARAWHAVPSLDWGYVQSIAEPRLLALACRYDTVIRLECQVGDFIGPGQPLLSLAAGQAPDRGMVAELNRAVGIDAYRTMEQDPAFGFRQLVDMAIKALSPGINDTTTAVTCLEHLGVALEHCARRDLAPRHCHEGGVLRLIVKRDDFEDFVTLAFGQIIENAEGNTTVMLKVLATIEKVAGACRQPHMSHMHEALRRQADIVEEVALRSAKSAAAGSAILQALDRVRKQDAETVQAARIAG